MSYTQEKGWFSRVNGYPVTKRPLNLSATSWAKGYPIGIAWHETAGCNKDIAGTLLAKGYGATFQVAHDGTIFQYRNLMQPSWHLFGASRYYMGIEHASRRIEPVCRLTDVQLAASAALSAAIVEWNKNKNGFLIPLRKVDGPDCSFSPGFHDHKDFAPCPWNTTKHGDGLYRWTWAEYLKAVGDHLNPPLIQVTATKTGQDPRTRKFDTLKEAWAWGKELVLHSWRVSYKQVRGD